MGLDGVTEELEGVTDVELADWVRQNYEALRTLCERNGLPKPPPT